MNTSQLSSSIECSLTPSFKGDMTPKCLEPRVLNPTYYHFSCVHMIVSHSEKLISNKIELYCKLFLKYT